MWVLSRTLAVTALALMLATSANGQPGCLDVNNCGADQSDGNHPGGANPSFPGGEWGDGGWGGGELSKRRSRCTDRCDEIRWNTEQLCRAVPDPTGAGVTVNECIDRARYEWAACYRRCR